MRFFLTLLAFAASLIFTAVAVFFAVIFLAGPHGGALPASLHTTTLAVGWLVVLAVPVLVARWAWRRQSHSSS